MIYPRPTEILELIDATIETKVEPSLSDLTGRSAVATIRHLLRLVRVQIEQEGDIFTTDIARLRQLLSQIHDYLRVFGAEGSEAAEKIGSELASHGNCQGYRSADRLAEEAGTLRESLYQALKHLQKIRDANETDDDYQKIRAAIRDYMVWQIAQEDRLIAPAFYGKGPRR